MRERGEAEGHGDIHTMRGEDACRCLAVETTVQLLRFLARLPNSNAFVRPLALLLRESSQPAAGVTVGQPLTVGLFPHSQEEKMHVPCQSFPQRAILHTNCPTALR